MNAIALAAVGANVSAENRRTISWLAVIFVLVSLLTSETVWARFFGVTDAEDMQISAPVAEAPIKLNAEMRRLVKLTETSGPERMLTANQAFERNASIPFSHNPVASAKPFHVAAETAMTALKCLTQAVYYEAAFEPLSGRRAVAQVVLNRAKHPAFPKSVCGVVYQGVNRPVCQFSFTCDGSLRRAPSPAKWQEAEAVARDALNGYVEPSVGYSTHYHANYVSPYWAPKLVKIRQIGAHIFYRWPGGWGMPRAFTGQYAGREAIPAILPRSLVVKDRGNPNTGAGMLADAEYSANGTQDNRSEPDAGGRNDTSKGWELALPEPDDTGRASRRIAEQQSGEF